MASLATGEDQVGPDNTDDEERASQVRDSGLCSSGAGGAHAPGETEIEIADTGFRDKNLKFDGLWEKLTLQPTKYTFYTIKVTQPGLSPPDALTFSEQDPGRWRLEHCPGPTAT